MKTLCLLSLLLLARAALAQEERAANTVILDARSERNLQIQSEVADTHAFETTRFALGHLREHPEKVSVLASRVPGRIVELLVREGDTVQAGQIVARLESRQPGNPPPVLDLLAPQAGTVSGLHMRVGQPVEPDGVLMEVGDFRELVAVLHIPEHELALGDGPLRARLRIAAEGGKVREAERLRLGTRADAAKGTVEAWFPVDNADGSLRPGLRVEAALVLARREGVLAVPSEAVQGTSANPFVFVRDYELPHAFVRAPVRVGERNDQQVEILEGLFTGDEVVGRGAYALGFVGTDSGVSLKEALDAAHGHEHNEDGSEITAADKRVEADGDVTPRSAHPALLAYAVLVTLLAIGLAERLRRAGAASC
jgi:cobalt-zinc-cadmium efflux system membrane fusion protein